MLKLDETHPLNVGVVQYLIRRGGKPDGIALPDSVKDPYMSQGSHPDVVERVWKVLGARLPEDCRCLVYGTPALVVPASGVILAFCLGTAYCLRLTPGDYEEALKLGYKTTMQWSKGHSTDLSREFGPDWVLGKWSADEIRWCVQTHESLNRTGEPKEGGMGEG